jgi:hypothetical protein
VRAARDPVTSCNNFFHPFQVAHESTTEKDLHFSHLASSVFSLAVRRTLPLLSFPGDKAHSKYCNVYCGAGFKGPFCWPAAPTARSRRMRSKQSILSAIFCIAAFSSICVAYGQPHSDEVTGLPGLKSKLDFQHFAGYLNVNATNNRNLFYWFTKASNASNDLVLWLNGGPGCSSVSGFFTENGPFVVKSDGSIKLNSFAWNTRANVLWLEAPAGVSYPHLFSNVASLISTCRWDFLLVT